jgi:RHS repeat-associated protein
MQRMPEHGVLVSLQARGYSRKIVCPYKARYQSGAGGHTSLLLYKLKPVNTGFCCLDGFVYENTTLAYFGTPEGRVLYTGGKLQPQYIITDQQGNARVTFINNDGTAKVIQENSYYAFGLVMTGGITPTDPNRNLYNGGSEWQNDFGDLPDLMQTYYRNYDQALGRWIGVDPMADEAESLTTYNYSGNNPVMFNDPLGDLNEKEDKDKDNNGTVLPEVTMIVGEPIHHDPFFSFLTGGAISIGGGWVTGGGNDFNFMLGTQIGKPKPGSVGNPIKLNEVKIKAQRSKVDYNKVGNVLSYIGDYGTIGVIGLNKTLNYSYNSLSTTMQIWNYNKYLIGGKVLDAGGRVVGFTGNVGTAINTINDVNSFEKGEISRMRLDYRLVGTAAGLGITSYFGAIPGIIVGRIGWAGEKSYDGVVMWLDATSKYVVDLNRGISNGWYPGK